MIRFVVWLLKRKKLSEKDRLVLTNYLLESIKTIPLRSLITQDPNRVIHIQGVPLSVEQSIALRESAKAALNSKARQTVQDQVRFAAIDKGYLKSYDQTDALFYKAAIWYSQEENQLLEWLAGEV